MSVDSTDPNTNTTPRITTDDVLGNYDASGKVEERLELARLHAAGNVATLLTAEDEEYVRRQSQINGAFISSVIKALPKARITGKTKSHETNISTTYDRSGRVKDIGSEIFIGPVTSEGKADESKLADIISARASVVWVRRGIDRVLEDSSDVYTKGGMSGRSTVLPYVVVGHRVTNDGTTQLLMGSLIPSGSSERFHYDYGGGTSISRNSGDLLVAEIHTSQYTRLMALQETLLGSGLEKEELIAMQDDKGNIHISPQKLAVIRAEHGAKRLLRIKDAPASKEALTREEFDLHIIEDRDTKLTPDEFVDFHVLEDTQRTAAMLGRAKAFHDAREKLEAETLEDPAILFINAAH